jgi:hypothetical protein
MIQRGHRTGFALEALGELLLRRFDRHHAVEARIAGRVHFIHANVHLGFFGDGFSRWCCVAQNGTK